MQQGNVTPLHKPNKEDMQKHLDLLFGPCEQEYPGGMLEIRCIHPTEKSNSGGKLIKAQLYSAVSDRAAAGNFAYEYNEKGFNVYVGVNPRKPGTPPFGAANAEDVEIAFFNFADIDRDESLNILAQGSPVPYTYSVTTGTQPNQRPHIYWQLEEPARNLKAWSEAQGFIADYFKSDRVIDPPRIMRLAGTVNWPDEKKEAKGYRVENVLIRTEYDDDRDPVPALHIYSTFAKLRPATTTPAPERREGDKLGLGVTGNVDVDRAINNIMAGNEWHNNMIRVVAHWMAMGRTDNEILLMCRNFTLPGYTIDDTDREVMQAILGGRRKGYDADAPSAPQTYTAPTQAVIEPSEGADVFAFDWFKDMNAALDTADLIEDTFGVGQMSVIYGESNCGKTFFMTDIAYHVASGNSWRGLRVESGLVIYLALEGKHGIRNRIAAIRKEAGITPSMPFIVISTGVNFLDAETDLTKLIHTIKKAEDDCGHKASLIVVDTLSRALAGGNENSPEDMGALVVNADWLRYNTNAHISLVHHSGKDQARGARGHSLLRAATDTEIEIFRNGDISTIAVRKQREYGGGEKYGFTLKGVLLGQNQHGKDITSCVVQETLAAPKRTVGRPKELNKTGKQALEVLIETIHDAGKVHHNREEFPNVPVVSEALFKEAYEHAGRAPEGAEATYYKRAVRNMQEMGIAVINKNYIWIVDMENAEKSIAYEAENNNDNK